MKPSFRIPRSAPLLALLAAIHFLAPPARAQTTITVTNWDGLITNWTEATVTNVGGGLSALACSADGTKMYTASFYPGALDISTNFGQVWIETFSPWANWSSIACSADGTKVAAAVLGPSLGLGGIYTSADSGLTWTQTSAPTNYWRCIASSADGTKLAAGSGSITGTTIAIFQGQIYTSADSGATWVQTSAPETNVWQCLASSADGTKLAATAQWYGGGGILISTNSGLTWVLSSAPLDLWYGIASSADGMRLVAAADGDAIYMSTNCGLAWSKTSAPQFTNGTDTVPYWRCVASSSDGTKLAAGENSGPVYVSSDAGATWTQAALPNSAWWAIAFSTDGTKLVVEDQVHIWVTHAPVRTVVVPTPSISQSGNIITVSWQALSGWTLQQNSSLTPPGAWTPSGGVSTSNGTNHLTVTNPAGTMFFRLASQ